MKEYQIRYSRRVLEQDAAKLDKSAKEKIRKAIESKLTVFPQKFAKPLHYTLKGFWSLRVGDWRVIFKIIGEQVWVMKIGHRSEIYNQHVKGWI